MIDNSYVIDPEQRAKAITELENAFAKLEFQEKI